MASHAGMRLFLLNPVLAHEAWNIPVGHRHECGNSRFLLANSLEMDSKNLWKLFEIDAASSIFPRVMWKRIISIFQLIIHAVSN